MRLGVLEVGPNTVHLLVVDAYPGARPLPAFSHKTELKPAAQLENGNSLSGPGESRLRGVVEEALSIAEDKGVEDIIAFATSAVREAVNGEQVLARIRERTGAQINVMTGQEEARLTFLAARRWFGWSSGRLLVIDIGGGSLEVASGIDEEPDAVVSLPLGAGRLSRDWISTDPPPAPEVRRLRKHVRAEIAREAGGMLRHGAPDQVGGTSKTFRQLGRIGGAAPSGAGPGRAPAEADPGRMGQAPGCLGQPGASVAGRRHHRRRHPRPAGGRPARAVPVGPARGRHPAAPGFARAGPGRITGSRAVGLSC